MKKFLNLAIVALFAVVMFAPSAEAYTGGLLNGKQVQIGANPTTIHSTTNLVTDGDETTFVTLGPATGDTSVTDHMVYQFTSDRRITAYQLKGDAMSNTATDYWNVRYYNAAGTIIYDNMAAVHSGLQTAHTAVNNVRTVVVHPYNTNASKKLYEFDVFGTDPYAPAAPTGLNGTPTLTTIDVTWLSVADEISGYNVYVDNVKRNTSLITGTAYELTGLTSGTTYSITVTAVDVAGNESSKSTARSVTTMSPDTTPPPTPTGFTASAGNTVANLSWTGVTADDFAGYHVFRNGVQLTASLITATSYQATGLTNDVAYEFYVKAFDTSGNGSAPSNAVTVTPSGEMTVTLVPNGTSIVVRIVGGTMPFTVTVDGGEPQTFSQREFAITGLAKDTDYSVVVDDDAGKTYSQTLNTGSTTSFIPPVMPDSTSLFQKMLNSFGTAGTIAIAVIGGAVALGVLIILGLWGWRLLKKWLASSK